MRLSRVEASGDGVFAVNTLLFIALHSYSCASDQA
jgi:hypothetical protein